MIQLPPESYKPPAILPHHGVALFSIIEVPPWYDILALEIEYMVPPHLGDELRVWYILRTLLYPPKCDWMSERPHLFPTCP